MLAGTKPRLDFDWVSINPQNLVQFTDSHSSPDRFDLIIKLVDQKILRNWVAELLKNLIFSKGKHF